MPDGSQARGSQSGCNLDGRLPNRATGWRCDRLQPGTLLTRARVAQQSALVSGSLHPIAATPKTVLDGALAFTVWQLDQPKTRFPANRVQANKPPWSVTDADPFLPYDPTMFVAHLTETHVCLLNKYNVLDDHLLLVTRTFERQTTWLTLADFEALRLCMAEFDGLAFYNGGKAAGASQRHKHLQYVPVPLTKNQSELPIAPAVASARWEGAIGTVNAFPFVHTLGRFDASGTPENMRETYFALLAAAGIEPGVGDTQTAPYNLLATREWMIIVPRSRESWRGIACNALGFAGSLLVRDEAQFRNLCEIGPLTMLQHVGLDRRL